MNFNIYKLFRHYYYELFVDTTNAANAGKGHEENRSRNQY